MFSNSTIYQCQSLLIYLLSMGLIAHHGRSGLLNGHSLAVTAQVSESAH